MSWAQRQMLLYLVFVFAFDVLAVALATLVGNLLHALVPRVPDIFHFWPGVILLLLWDLFTLPYSTETRR